MNKVTIHWCLLVTLSFFQTLQWLFASLQFSKSIEYAICQGLATFFFTAIKKKKCAPI